jgi:prophage maintenance system killer protein/prophage antirepressor-like protein
MSEIIIYESDENQIQVDVEFDGTTVWLNLNQLATLFGRDKSVISRHLNKVFKNNELEKDSVVAKNATTASDGKIYQVEYFNLDAIISVGYKVNSKQGTQFRKWANTVLKEYLVKGFAINENRLAQKEQQIKILKDGIHILNRSVAKAIEDKASDTNLLETFAKGLSLLDDYDHEELDNKGVTTTPANFPSLETYQKLINQMLIEFDSAIFGKEKDKSFQSSVAQIGKGFGEDDFYPTLEEKATMLLYLVVKNHSFVDGNKRIAAACFLKFLEQNNMLFNEEEQLIVNNDTLATLTLFIASSKPDEMETVKRLVISILNRNK